MNIIKYLKKIFRKINKNYEKEYLLNRALVYFKNSEKILDVGSGDGEFLYFDKRIVGLDGNKKSVQIANKNKLNVRYGLVTKLPFKKNTFDGIHCSHVIEHLFPKDAYKMLTEISRVLKKDGIFVLTTPVMWDGFYDDFTHIKPYNPRAIKRYLIDEGQNKTLKDIDYKYEIVDFFWIYKTLPLFNGKFTYLIANFLYQYKIHSYTKNAYTLVLRKC